MKERRSKAIGWALVAIVLVGAALTVNSRQSTAAFDPGPYPPAQADTDGIVRQTTRMSCAPAAAATLLRALKIAPGATEHELAILCRTDPRLGTPDPDLRAGLEAASGRPVDLSRLTLKQLRARTAPCVLFVALNRERAGSEALYRELRDQCGWPEGEAHAVVFFGLESGKRGEDVEVALIGDPRSGLERWGITHFNALWDHRLIAVR